MKKQKKVTLYPAEGTPKQPLECVSLGLHEIHPDPDNARTHDERNVDAIADSLRQFEQQKPIVVRRSGPAYEIVAGNGTRMAALKLGWTHLDAVVSELPEKAAAAYGIADNRTAELAGWDDDTLKGLLDELSGDFPNLGFDDPAGFSNDDVPNNISDQYSYSVVVECLGEMQQAELLERFEEEGLKCRALTL